MTRDIHHGPRASHHIGRNPNGAPVSVRRRRGATDVFVGGWRAGTYKTAAGWQGKVRAILNPTGPRCAACDGGIPADYRSPNDDTANHLRFCETCTAVQDALDRLTGTTIGGFA
jgi:hypothetical protein